MEYLCPTGHIQVTDVVYSKLKEKYSAFEERRIEVKGKGTMQTYVINPSDCLSFSRTKHDDSLSPTIQEETA